ncbi:NAD(P)H-dependent oxidoreductase [Streptomyces sp. NPDC046977]|uniref:NADPH-dependent FMN reductase n=1 Tax=Streptomyces sp. NPDC046977 TaxID=3154703 RepID=UPI0033D7D6FC
MKIGVILGSTRPGRLGASVASWVMEHAEKRTDAEFGLVDVDAYRLPLLDEPLPPILQQVTHQHTKDWAAAIAGYDAFVFIVAEYNRSVPGALKNALDYLFHEWHNKAAGIVSYGGVVGGARAAESLRLVLGELKVATTREGVFINTRTDFENWTVFTPTDQHVAALNTVFDEVVAWGSALKPLREA